MSVDPNSFPAYLADALNEWIKSHGNEDDRVFRQSETELVYVDTADKRFYLITVEDAHAVVQPTAEEVGKPSKETE